MNEHDSGVVVIHRGRRFYCKRLSIASSCEQRCNWGEPERAPHRLVECSQSIYYIYNICMVRPSHARRYIHCTQCAIYSGGRMKKLLHSPVPRA